MNERESIVLTVATLLQVGLARVEMVPERSIDIPVAGQKNVFRPTRVVDSFGITRILASQWPSMREFQDVVDLLKGAALASSLRTSRTGRELRDLEWTFAVGAYVSNLFADYVTALGHAKFDEDRFSELANRWVDSITNGHREVMLWAPLFSFGLRDYAEPIKLATGISMVKPSQEQLASLADPFVVGGYFPSPPQGDFPEFFLSASVSCPVADPFNPLNVETLADVALATRLAVGGDAGIRQVGSVPRPADCRPYAAGYFQDVARTLPRGLRESRLEVRDIDQVDTLLEKLPAARKVWPTALRRYAQIPYRVDIEDRLVDAVIALEALLAPDKAEEISYRFKFRGAWLIGGTDRKTREAWAERLAKAYRIRSILVHGSAKEVDKLKPDVIQGCLEECDAALRQLLQEVVLNPQTREAWQRNLDSIVLG